MTYTEISARLAELGQPIPTLGLTRIEKGERRVDVDEVIALAQVFDVPPIVLMFPIGHDEETELLPGQRLVPWLAAKWFMGKATLGDEPKSREAAIIGLFEKHDALMEEAGTAWAYVQLWPGDPSDPKRNEAARQWRVGLRDLRTVRAQIRQFKLRPPTLDEGLEMVDDTTYRFLTPTELASQFPDGGYPPGLLVEKTEHGTVRPVNFSDGEDRRHDGAEE